MPEARIGRDIPKIGFIFQGNLQHCIYNLGCDLRVLKRITEFRVDRQAEKNGQFDFEVRTKLNGGVKWEEDKWSQEKMSM